MIKRTRDTGQHSNESKPIVVCCPLTFFRGSDLLSISAQSAVVSSADVCSATTSTGQGRTRVARSFTGASEKAAKWLRGAGGQRTPSTWQSKGAVCDRPSLSLSRQLVLKETVHLQKNIKQSIFKQILYLKCEE